MEHKIELIITSETVKDLFVAALEGGSNYWLRGIDYCGFIAPEEQGVIWWGSTNIFEDPLFTAKVTFDAPDGEEGNAKGKKFITIADIEKGLDLMKDPEIGNPIALGRIIAEDYDAEDADTFMQLVVLGGVIYG